MTRIKQALSSLVKLAAFAGCVYLLYEWSPIGEEDGGTTAFAERACADAALARFDGSNVRVYDIRENNDGYVVRASITLANGNAAKVVCLTSSHGNVRDITIDQR